MLTLYSGPLSLFSRKVEIALAEKGLPFERVAVPFSQHEGYSPRHPAVLAANPKAQVPVLVDRDLAVFDSTVILEYLEDAYPEPPLYPADAAARARCGMLELYADDVMLVPLKSLMHRTGPRPAEPGRWQALEGGAAAAASTISAQHAELDRRLAGRETFFDRLGVADIAVFVAILWGGRLGGPSLAAHPALAAWYGRLAARPAFREVAAQLAAADRRLSAPVPGAWPDRNEA